MSLEVWMGKYFSEAMPVSDESLRTMLVSGRYSGRLTATANEIVFVLLASSQHIHRSREGVHTSPSGAEISILGDSTSLR